MLSSRHILALPEAVLDHFLAGNPAAIDQNVGILYVWLNCTLYEYQLPLLESMTEQERDMLQMEVDRNPVSGRQWLAILSAKGKVPELPVMVLASELSMDLLRDAGTDLAKIFRRTED